MTAEVEWHGVLLQRDELNSSYLASTDELADAARDGAWARMFDLLDGRGIEFTVGVNEWRRGGTSWFSPLHQAAWHGASASVVEDLVNRGAWRALRDAQGRRPIDIARERGADHIIDVLEPRNAHPASDRSLSAMSRALAELVVAAARQANCAAPIRHLDVACLVESGAAAWFPIPGMYGGFSMEMFRGRLSVESWSRVVGGSGRAYVITADRTTLVDEGFV